MREAQQNIVPFHGTFSRHGKAQASLAQPICLNEKVPFHKIRERDNDHRLRIFPFTQKKNAPPSTATHLA